MATPLSALGQNSLDPVAIEGGQVSGVATDLESVTVYKGLPYAGPTGGDNRWRPPTAVVPWDGVRVADSWGDRAAQNAVIVEQPGTFWQAEFYFDKSWSPGVSESGLNLNVWTPAQSAGAGLPVYVYIHGGGNRTGHASEVEFNASKLAALGIVVVTVQYRLGALGFMATPELAAESPHGAAGNYAILDLVQALKWVKANIAGFGGEPDTVTVGGQSAGAANTVGLLKTPLARGLFKRAVVQSSFGGLLNVPFSTVEDKAAETAAGLEKLFGKPVTLAELRAMPTDDLFVQDDTGMFVDKFNNAAPVSYTLDNHVFTPDSINLLRPGALDGIDIMIGGTSDEFTSLAIPTLEDKTLTDDEFVAEMTKAGFAEGFGEVYNPSTPSEAFRFSIRAAADRNFQSALLSAEAAADASPGADIYAFWFNHAPAGRNAEYFGAYHSADLWYFFNSLRDQKGQRHWTGADHSMGRIVSSYLASFVKTGDPNSDALPNWPKLGDGDAGGKFIWFTQGHAIPVETTPYPERDAYLRKQLITANRLSVEP